MQARKELEVLLLQRAVQGAQTSWELLHRAYPAGGREEPLEVSRKGGERAALKHLLPCVPRGLEPRERGTPRAMET